jgi:hypothetical protein
MTTRKPNPLTVPPPEPPKEGDVVTVSLARFKSLEFILALLTTLGAWAAQLAGAGNVTPHDAILLTAASAGFYSLARGLAKVNADGKPFYMTSEFYGAIIGAGTAVAGQLDGAISPNVMQIILGALAVLAMVSNGLRTPPAKATAQNPGVQ